ncbi:uncharacterized protein LOC107273689 [Cephus cinctus]|uniref:Uncharacterized protein LOC107273689 n=1 Tax=Cephus cinctus TaxID=211228 RepID=A0AAJ7RU73_CEPCN|nr:uncharacterized protein LOC107273689 [Cephus cinctus]
MKCATRGGRIQNCFSFIIFLSITQISTLTIDNQLVIIANDCYTRISIGTRLADKDVLIRTSAGTVTDCENECSKNRNTCKVFSFGISSKGNGTCTIGSRVPNPEELDQDQDYDVYIRRQDSPDCEPDRLYQLGSGGKRPSNGSAVNEFANDRYPTGFGNGIKPQKPNGFQSNRPGQDQTYRKPSFNQGWFSSFDDDRRVYDIIRNKNRRPNNKSPMSGSSFTYDEDQRPFDDVNDHKDIPRPGGFGTFSIGRPSSSPGKPVTPKPKPIDDESSLTVKPVYNEDGNSNPGGSTPGKYQYWIDHNSGSEHNSGHPTGSAYGFTGNGHSQTHNIIHVSERPRPAGSDQFIYDKDNPNPVNHHGPINSHSFHGYNSNDYDDTHSGFPGILPGHKHHYDVIGHGIDVFENPSSCYRRLLSGKRIVEIHIRRAIDCERIDDCNRECDSEKAFNCEGFNYRRMGPGPRGMCELTSVPYSRMDMHRDFISDPHYDYYEKDSRCDQDSFGDVYHRPSGWTNLSPRPGSGYRPNDQGGYGPSRRPQEPPRHEPRPYLPERRPGPDKGPIDRDRRPMSGYGPDRDRPDDLYHRKPYLPERRPFDIPLPPGRRPGEPDRDHFSVGRPYPSRPVGSVYIGPIEDNMFHGDFRPGRPHLPKFPERRPDFGYRPFHDIGSNEIGPYLPDRRKDWDRDWGSYGGTYGGSYGYDTNSVGKFHLPKDPNHHKQHKRPRPFENDNFYGEFYNYGGAFGYGDNYIPSDKDVLYGGSGKRHECSVRSGAGVKVRRGLVRKSYLTSNLDQCESLCTVEKDFLCMTFSYRYNLASTAPTDNCLLSEISYEDLNFYTDLEPDRDYDIYTIVGNSKSCSSGKPPSRRPPEECFWRVRSGFGMALEVIKKSMSVDSLGECEVECVDTRGFTCRSFVYRYGHLPIGGSPNCFLSDWPSQEMDPFSLPDMDGAELYERGSFGRGCEPYPFPPLRKKYGSTDKKPSHRDDFCYSTYHRPCKLTPYAILLSIRVNGETECRQRCSSMREKDYVPCMSFSYNIENDRRNDNCFLSDVPRRDLRPGLDYIHDDDYVLYAWKELEPECIPLGYPDVPSRPDYHSHGFESPGYSDQDKFDFHSGGRPSRPPYFTDLGPTSDHGPGGIDYGRKPGHGGNSYGHPGPSFDHDLKPGEGPYGSHEIRPGSGGNGYPGIRPFDPDRPDPIAPGYGVGSGVHGGGEGFAGYGGGGGNFGGFNGYGSHDDHGGHRFGSGYGSGGSDFRPGSSYGGDRFDLSYPGDLATFTHYTVNGHPCKRGTKCQRNKVAGFWSCEPEGEEYGSWDYCCEPTHHCGFSHGYSYPWCYVGPKENQWRPCSEQYFPYSSSSRPHRPSSLDRFDQSSRFDDIPKPGFFGRHWPVAYLHREAPPNTTDSLALADDRRDRKLNDSKLEKRSNNEYNQSRNQLKSLRLKLDTSNENTEESLSVSSNKPDADISFFRKVTAKYPDVVTRTLGSNGKIERVFPPRNEATIPKIITAADINFEKSNSTTSAVKFIEVPLLSSNRSKVLDPDDYFEIVDIE